MFNLSDGKSDGIVLFYLKDKKLYSVLLPREQAEVLDIALGAILGEETLKIAPADDVQKYLIKRETNQCGSMMASYAWGRTNQKPAEASGPNVKWDGPYNDAQDDAVPYCSTCDEEIKEGHWTYCPICGTRLIW